MDRELTTEMPHVYRLALRFCRDRHLAEDLTQETMLKAVRNKGQLQTPERLRVWLLRILANTWKDYLRSKLVTASAINGSDVVDQRQSPADKSSAQQEDLQRALNAMDSLPEKQRAVLHLFAVEELSLQEIGAVLNMQPATARVNLFHARQAMKKKLPHMAQHTEQDATTRTQP